MTELGDLILLAMASQSWAVAFHGEEVLVWSPVSRKQIRIPRAWFTDRARDTELRMGLLALVAQHGLTWEDDPRFGGMPFLN